ncbi:TonB-dependent receptor plug domain protein, partial [mine drainage metagenome]
SGTKRRRNTHLQQELRISTPKSWRLRGLAGIFYEDYKIYDLTQWMYKTVPSCSPTGLTSNCFLPIQPWPGSPYTGVQNGNVAFIDDTVRTFIQKAAYTSISYDIVPHKLTITGGIRYFDMYERELGGDVSSFGCKQFVATTYFGSCLTATGTNFANQNPNSFVETGKRGRANLTWHVIPGVMLYY